jgi:hypothetical protein
MGPPPMSPVGPTPFPMAHLFFPPFPARPTQCPAPPLCGPAAHAFPTAQQHASALERPAQPSTRPAVSRAPPPSPRSHACQRSRRRAHVLSSGPCVRCTAGAPTCRLSHEKTTCHPILPSTRSPRQPSAPDTPQTWFPSPLSKTTPLLSHATTRARSSS